MRRTTTGGSSTITRRPSRTVVSLDSAFRLVRWRALAAVFSARERAGLSGAAAMIDSTSRRECHTSNADSCAIFAISARYSAAQPCTAALPSPSESPDVLAATTKLAASRLTIPLPRSGLGLVEVVQIEDLVAFGRGEGAEVIEDARRRRFATECPWTVSGSDRRP